MNIRKKNASPIWMGLIFSPPSLSTARKLAFHAAANEKSVRMCASSGETCCQLAHHTGARRLCKNARTQNNQLFATRAYATINRAPSSRRSVPNARPCAKPHNDLGTCNAKWPLGPHSRVPARLRDAHACKQKSWTRTKRRCVPTWQMRAVLGHLPQVHGLTSINANACTLWANNPDVRRRQTTRQTR